MTAVEPEVVRVLREFRAQLLLREELQMRQMALRWLEVERAIEGAIRDLVAEIERMRQAGETISLGKLTRMERYRKLLAQARVEYGRYEAWAAPMISRNQLLYGQLGLENAVTVLNTAYAEAGRLGLAFDRLPVRAVETMIGLAGDGTPLNRLLRQSWPEAVEGLTSALITATAQGWNPIRTAAAMRDGFGLGLNRSMNIARTEQLRVARAASQMQYEESGVVIGYKRFASKDACAACLLADGTFYPLGTIFEEHPSGRCNTIPVVAGMPPVEWQTGRDWFMEQDAATQRSILGPGHYDAWKAGKFGLDDIVKRHVDPTWGASLVTKPLRELVH